MGERDDVHEVTYLPGGLCHICAPAKKHLSVWLLPATSVRVPGSRDSADLSEIDVLLLMLYGKCAGAALAHYLLRRYAVRTTRAGKYRGRIPAARLNRVLDFMRQNYAPDIRLWELAQLAGMSSNYFCELFKQSKGLSRHQYLLQLRISRAKACLRNPEATVSQVAEATGFADQSHFTKVFRRIVGITPAQFRAG